MIVLVMVTLMTLVSQHDDGPSCFVMVMTIRNCNKCMAQKSH